MAIEASEANKPKEAYTSMDNLNPSFFSFFDYPEQAELNTELKFLYLQPRDVNFSLMIMQPKEYIKLNGVLTDRKAEEKRQGLIKFIQSCRLRLGTLTPTGKTQLGYTHNINRVKQRFKLLSKLARAEQAGDKKASRQYPTLKRIWVLTSKKELNLDEVQELKELRFKLSPSYKAKRTEELKQMKAEFKRLMAEFTKSQQPQ